MAVANKNCWRRCAASPAAPARRFDRPVGCLLADGVSWVVPCFGELARNPASRGLTHRRDTQSATRLAMPPVSRDGRMTGSTRAAEQVFWYDTPHGKR